MFLDFFSILSPISLLMVLPLIILLIYSLNFKNRPDAIKYTGLEYLLLNKNRSGRTRNQIRVGIYIVVITGLGLLWANPVTYSANPIFGGAVQVNKKLFMVAFDMSPSMNLTMGDVTEENKRGLRVNDEGVTKYEIAKGALYGFLERFNGNAFGLILFSTEPFLARWPTTETSGQFLEVLDDSLRRGSRSQLESYSGLTNTDNALFLARDIILENRTTSLESSAVILIADAWDEVESVESAIRSLRNEDINLYIIGTGVPEDIIDELTQEFKDDDGFKIFHVDSEAEMEQAYYLIGNIEESDSFEIGERFETNIRWLIALILLVITVMSVWALEGPLHRSSAGTESRRISDGLSEP